MMYVMQREISRLTSDNPGNSLDMVLGSILLRFNGLGISTRFGMRFVPMPSRMRLLSSLSV